MVTFTFSVLDWKHPFSANLVQKISFLFFKSFLLVSTKLSFWQGDWALGWALGYHSMGFRHFPDISLLPKVLSLKSFGNW